MTNKCNLCNNSIVEWVEIWARMLTDNYYHLPVVTKVFGMLNSYGVVPIRELIEWGRQNGYHQATIQRVVRKLKDRKILTQSRDGWAGPWVYYPSPEFEYVIKKWFMALKKVKR